MCTLQVDKWQAEDLEWSWKSLVYTCVCLCKSWFKGDNETVRQNKRQDIPKSTTQNTTIKNILLKLTKTTWQISHGINVVQRNIFNAVLFDMITHNAKANRQKATLADTTTLLSCISIFLNWENHPTRPRVPFSCLCLGESLLGTCCRASEQTQLLLFSVYLDNTVYWLQMFRRLNRTRLLASFLVLFPGGIDYHCALGWLQKKSPSHGEVAGQTYRAVLAILCPFGGVCLCMFTKHPISSNSLNSS